MNAAQTARPCQNHLGFALIAATITRLTPPETASWS
jgi:hypothetical protein